MAKPTMAALFTKKNPGGIFVIDDILEHGTGNVYFVDSGSGASTNSGNSPTSAMATIDQAIGKCTANQGDSIFVLEGHAENVTAADGINADVAGIKIIGIGHGADVPTVSYTAAAGSLTIAAASVWIQNIKFVANFATGTTAGITIAAAGDNCTLKDLIMRDTSAANEFLKHVQVATTVNDLTIEGCDFQGLAGTMSSSVFFVGTTSNLMLRDNYWFVDASGSVVDHLADVPTGCSALDNDAVNFDTGAGLVFSYKSDGAATGYFARNTLFGNKDDAEPLAATNDYVKMDNAGGNTIASSGRNPHPAAVAAVP